MAELLNEEDLAELRMLARIPEGLSTRDERERLVDLRRQHANSLDDRVG